ncbi:MAG TPA: hypothetical protein VK465_16200 [Fibrobacteria bacterium]|nr:hypothetical protein [Fibrobacteria bacterium]
MMAAEGTSGRRIRPRRPRGRGFGTGIFLLAIPFLSQCAASKGRTGGEAPTSRGATLALAHADTMTWGRSFEARMARASDAPRIEYEKTQARTISGTFPPYIREYAELNDIDTVHLLRALFSEGPPPSGDSQAVDLTSLNHITGSWTHYYGPEIRIHQLLKVRVIPPPADTILLALYSHASPKILLEGSQGEWLVAVLDKEIHVTSKVRFGFPTRQGEDWIQLGTAMDLDNGEVLVRVERVGERGHEDVVHGKRIRLRITAPGIKVQAVNSEEYVGE